MNKPKGKNILLGVCGGIAAYKVPSLVSLLVQEGYAVRVVLSESGARFVSREALEVLSGQKVYTSLWDDCTGEQDALSPVLHVHLVDEADVFLLAPARYNWIGKAASGIADDLLSVLFSAWPAGQKPLLFAPAMNPEMWQQAVLQQNLLRLQGACCELIVPGSGFLACRAEGQGRMVEVDELFFRLESRLRYLGPCLEGPPSGLGEEAGSEAAGLAGALAGKRLLLTAGSTYEALDPVRYISNRSSGRTGLALACAARDMGAEVTLILGVEQLLEGQGSEAGSHLAEPMTEPMTEPSRAVGAREKLGHNGASLASSAELFDIRVLLCNSAVQMAELAEREFPDCDWAFAVAAVCDFRPLERLSQKMKKQPQQKTYALEFQLNPDILAYWGQHKGSAGQGQRVLGFALEGGAAEQAQQYALDKLYAKGADAIVLNSFSNLEGNMAQARLLWYAEQGKEAVQEAPIALQDKRAFASQLLLLLVERWG